jgi:hypothetical protein
MIQWIIALLSLYVASALLLVMRIIRREALRDRYAPYEMIIVRVIRRITDNMILLVYVLPLALLLLFFFVMKRRFLS